MTLVQFVFTYVDPSLGDTSISQLSLNQTEIGQEGFHKLWPIAVENALLACPKDCVLIRITVTE